MSYSLENEQRFGWSSVTGDLPKDRLAYLEYYIVGQKKYLTQDVPEARM